VLVDRRATHEPLVELELADGVEERPGGGHDLGAYAVAGQEDDPWSLRHGA
jgi:hypothetical protein